MFHEPEDPMSIKKRSPIYKQKVRKARSNQNHAGADSRLYKVYPQVNVLIKKMNNRIQLITMSDAQFVPIKRVKNDKTSGVNATKTS